jgi:hypothetical protein
MTIKIRYGILILLAVTSFSGMEAPAIAQAVEPRTPAAQLRPEFQRVEAELATARTTDTEQPPTGQKLIAPSQTRRNGLAQVKTTPAPKSAVPTEPTPQRRSLRPQDVWQAIYQQLPNLPLENQYVNRDTGKVVPDNTLVSRLMRYHLYTKGRPAAYRLDWKLTLADYLGANEPIEPLTYPGADALKQNPLEADVVAIKKLDRTQRNALVQVLVDIFDPNAKRPPTPAVAPSPAPNAPTRPTPPESGGARLLLP